MEFYLAGGIGMGVGFALRAFVFRSKLPKRHGPGRRRLEFAVIFVVVAFWIFGPLAFAGAVDTLTALGAAPVTRSGGGGSFGSEGQPRRTIHSLQQTGAALRCCAVYYLSSGSGS